MSFVRTGEPDRAPVRPGIPVTDILTGFAAVKSILAAWISRLKTGKGGIYIDCAMFDVQVSQPFIRPVVNLMNLS